MVRSGMKYGNGFTLIELMIVLTIMGMLASIMIPQIMKAKYQAHYAVCQQNLQNLGTALEIYRTDNGGRYPDTYYLFVLWQKQYSERPVCPTDPEKKDYGYDTNIPDTNYTLYCKGVHLVGGGMLPNGFPQYSPSCGLILEKTF